MKCDEEQELVKAARAFLNYYTQEDFKVSVLPTQEWELRFESPETGEPVVYKSKISAYDLYKTVLLDLLK